MAVLKLCYEYTVAINYSSPRSPTVLLILEIILVTSHQALFLLLVSLVHFGIHRGRSHLLTKGSLKNGESLEVGDIEQLPRGFYIQFYGFVAHNLANIAYNFHRVQPKISIFQRNFGKHFGFAI